MSRVLDLRLYGVYFDEIVKGTKKKEFREITDYYVGRLIGGVNNMDKEQFDAFVAKVKDPLQREEAMKKAGAYIRFNSGHDGDYTHVRFRRGSTNTFAMYKIDNIEFGQRIFVISIGKRDEGK